MSSNELEARYARLCAAPSDINEHLPTLRNLASGVRVVELGVRFGHSTAALAAGAPVSLDSYDIKLQAAAHKVHALAVAAGVDMRLHQADDLAIDIPECDLLFIDTWHSGTQLEKELNRHAHAVRKHIALHDTTTFGQHGETDGIPWASAVEPGLLSAIDAFMATAEGARWRVAKVWANNNGLTLLERVS